MHTTSTDIHVYTKISHLIDVTVFAGLRGAGLHEAFQISILCPSVRPSVRLDIHLDVSTLVLVSSYKAKLPPTPNIVTDSGPPIK